MESIFIFLNVPNTITFTSYSPRYSFDYKPYNTFEAIIIRNFFQTKKFLLKPNYTDSTLMQYISQKTTGSRIPLVIVYFIRIKMFVIKHVPEPHCEESNIDEILLHLIHPIYVNHKSWNDDDLFILM